MIEDNHELTKEEFSEFMGALPSFSIEEQIEAIRAALEKTTLKSNAEQLRLLIDATNRKLLGITLG
jgi:cystathionine beta-lyase/cystathionine gamma-synthase